MLFACKPFIVLKGCFSSWYVEVVLRVDVLVVDEGFEVDVWSGDVAGGAHFCDFLTLSYSLTHLYFNFR